MKTLYTESVEEAAAIIKSGGIAAFPTETVYGLGADVFNPAAIERIFEAKGRPADNPLIVHISRAEQIKDLTSEVTESAKLLIKHFFPGPLTVILKKSDRVPSSATADLETVAVRMPDHEIAHGLIDACGTPLVAPSANLSGKPSPTSWEAVKEDLDGRIECVLIGGPAEIGIESTVVDCTAGVPVLLRTGALSIDEIRAFIPEVRKPDARDESAGRSPGLRHKHYAPAAQVFVVESGSKGAEEAENAGFIGLANPAVPFLRVLICKDADDYARSLFEFFRLCDREGISEIYCEAVGEEGIGAALMDRIRRAADH